eukprot:TRINITY_DN7512_c0_g1_i1.p2 TRINITY_DN7512_c0_g1~~TRINITY_DN7512_c0_g1_i1.p2  ORF type:complete len:120 (-),score=14.77 TRINITY_DN7512_c0_g1_i1:357-716(-)
MLSLNYECLQSLSLVNIPGLRNFVPTPLDQSSALRKLKLQHCNNLSDDFGKNLNGGITKLVVRDCVGISNAFVHHLPASLKQLHISLCPKTSRTIQKELQGISTVAIVFENENMSGKHA